MILKLVYGDGWYAADVKRIAKRSVGRGCALSDQSQCKRRGDEPPKMSSQ